MVTFKYNIFYRIDMMLERELLEKCWQEFVQKMSAQK